MIFIIFISKTIIYEKRYRKLNILQVIMCKLIGLQCLFGAIQIIITDLEHDQHGAPSKTFMQLKMKYKILSYIILSYSLPLVVVFF